MLKKLILYFLKPIPHYSNIFLLNFFGFQIIRYFIFRFYIEIKKSLYKAFHKKKFNSLKEEYKSLLNKLNQDGCVIIENIFDEKDFSKIISLTQSIPDKTLKELREKDNNEPIYKYYNLNHIQCNEFFDSKIFISIIKNNKVISDLFFLLNYSFIENNMVSFQKIKPITLNNQEHINSLLHTDRFYKFHKFFISINDVTKRNAAFKYCKGSQKYNFRKHYFEYIGSILESLNYFIKPIFPLLKYNRYTVKKYLDLKISNIESNKNCLIIENGSGFHAAGKFEDLNNERKYIRINPLNANDYYYLPFALTIYNLFTRLKKL